MNKIRFKLRGFVMIGLTLVFGASGAFAAPQTFVSTSGKDFNACTRSQPCRTFATALSAVDAEGEVIVLDSGSYGAVTITKAVSLIAPAGVNAAINSAFGDAVIV